jgi:tRNA threonylcarbamoyladenosine biosynthesis protein TsaE
LWFHSPSPEHTRRAAHALAAALGDEGAVLSLVGPLGAGKTAFVKGLAEGLGLDPQVVGSPTFVIACEYPLPDGRRLGHVDLYRVKSEDELDAAGFLDLLVPGVVLAVEWGDRLPGALPRDHLEVRIDRLSPEHDQARRFSLHPGKGAEALAERFRSEVAAAGFETHDQGS